MAKTLSSVDYSEDALPQLPPEAPKIMTWILHRCLKRDPSKRPRADEIADILHVWCLVRHLHRRQKASILRNLHQTSSKSVDILPEEILNPMQSNKAKLMLSNNRLCELLNIFWAADWLTGAAQPLQGIRSMFYSRATPGRFELCLDVLHSVDSLNRDNLIDSIYN
ncbi:unnamed protein product [Trichobilharzia regenti]|nr:unnamed protein product [Trichobilharzia regenti]